MSEPMGEDVTSGKPSARSLWRRINSPFGFVRDDEDEEQLLDAMSKAFHLNFELLSAEAQQVYIWPNVDGNISKFREGLEDLLERRKLDEALIQSEDIRTLAIELFGDKYSYLKMLRLGVEESEVFEGRGLEHEKSNAAEGAARVVQTVVATTQSVTSVPILRLRSHPGDKAAEKTTPPTRQKQPAIPGFTISTRKGRSGESRPSAEASGSRAPGSETITERGTSDGDVFNRQSRDSYNENWLRNWLRSRGIATTDDLNLHPYKGWNIEAPKIQLIRAKNFLCDEDGDRTIGWKTKFAELAEYFAYLLDNYQGEDWGYDLKQAIDMLHTHWVFENYHYGRPKLVLDFPNVWPRFSNRLPPIPGPKIDLGPEDPVDMGLLSERKLIHTEIGSAHDKHYRLESDDLYEHYIKEYEFDTRDYWEIDQYDENGDKILPEDQPSSVAHQARTWNMIEAEDQAYIKCMNGGMPATAEFLDPPDRGHFRNGIIEGPDGTKQATNEALESFAKFRGRRRAALQQCLNKCNNYENRVTCNHWRALILPTPPRLPDKPDAGIIFNSAHLSYIPDKAARDPFAYTMALNWYKKSESHWSQWTRNHAIKEVYGHRNYLKRKEPPMDLPMNFMGPYHANYMDMEMKKHWELMRRCQKLLQRLKRAAKRAPRQFIDDVLHYVKSGQQGVDWTTLDLNFRQNELMEDGDGGTVRIRPMEEEWLHFLGSDSVNEQMLAVRDREEQSPLSRLFQTKIRNMLQDLSPVAFFCDCKPKSVAGLMRELNNGGSGRIKPYQFTEEEVIRELRNCAEQEILRLWYALDGSPVIARPDVNLYPEHRVKWLDSDHHFEEPPELPDYNEDAEEADDVASATSTISTDVDVPPSEEYFGAYTVGMPKLVNLRSWDECLTQGDAIRGTEEKIKTFFYSLGYRLGDTLRMVEAGMKRHREQLTPKQKHLNLEFQQYVMDVWEDDTMKRPNNPRKNAEQTSDTDRVTPKYRDVIKIAEPEIYNEKDWGGMTMMDDYINETSEIVRKAVVKEAYENKSLLFPTRTVWFTGKDGTTREVPRREPVWSFGHPASRGVVKRFWDINRWPLHLQSEKTRELIQADGPEKGEAGNLPRPQPQPQTQPQPQPQPQLQPQPQRQSQPSTSPARAEPSTAGMSRMVVPEDITISYAERAMDRRRFQPGQEFWGGDTPLQRRAMEDHFRRRLETTEDPSWTERLAGYWPGAGDKNKSPTLPVVSSRSIPKSRPRLPSFEGDGDPGDESGGDPDAEPDEDIIMDDIPLPATETPPSTPANPIHRQPSSSRQDIDARQTVGSPVPDFPFPFPRRQRLPRGRSQRVALEVEELQRPTEVVDDEIDDDDEFDFV